MLVEESRDSLDGTESTDESGVLCALHLSVAAGGTHVTSQLGA